MVDSLDSWTTIFGISGSISLIYERYFTEMEETSKGSVWDRHLGRFLLLGSFKV